MVTRAQEQDLLTPLRARRAFPIVASIRTRYQCEGKNYGEIGDLKRT